VTVGAGHRRLESVAQAVRPAGPPPASEHVEAAALRQTGRETDPAQGARGTDEAERPRIEYMSEYPPPRPGPTALRTVCIDPAGDGATGPAGPLRTADRAGPVADCRTVTERGRSVRRPDCSGARRTPAVGAGEHAPRAETAFGSTLGSIKGVTVARLP
jgi:hypothetical protein